jgi:hypothetical protein
LRVFRTNPLLGFALLSFFLLRLAKLALGGGAQPIVTPDSGTYRPADAGWLDFSAVLEAKRPFVMTFTYALIPNDQLRVVSQSLFFTFCWMSLLIAIYFALNKPWVRNLGLLSFWLLGFSSLTSQWESLVLSESLTISLLAASIAAVLVWLTNRKQKYLVISIILLIIAALIRPQLFVVVALSTLIWWVFGNRLISVTKNYISAGVLLTVGLLLAISQQVLNDARFSSDNLVNRTTWIYTNSLLPGSPFAERLRVALPESAPACIKPDGPLGDTAGQFLIDEYRADCPEGLAWIKSEFQSFYFSFLLEDPITTARDTSRLLWDSAAMYVYGVGGEIGPSEGFTSLFALDQSRTFVLGALITVVTVLVSWPYLRKRPRESIVFSWVLVGAFTLSWIAALLLQIADLHRTSVTSIVPINIFLLASFLFALDGLPKIVRSGI